MPNEDKVLIFDLDETILTVNSFPHWVKYLLFGPFPGLTMADLLKLRLDVTRVMLERKLLRVSHAQTKLQLQALWSAAIARDPERKALENFCTRLETLIRPNMRGVLSAVHYGSFEAILATAAAECYAEAFGKRLGFQHVLASGRTDNRATQKRDRIILFLNQMNWHRRKRIFFTDHEEDLPLIKECHRVIWLGSTKTLAKLKAETSVEIVEAAHLPEIGISDHF